MDPEKIEIPDELRSLNPETQRKVVVIGTKAYAIYPLTEGQVERMSQLISEVLTDIFTEDLICPNCNYVFKGKLGKQETCNKCKGKNRLESMQRAPIEALTHEDRAIKFIQEVLGLRLEDLKEELTIPQFKHLAGVLYEQNFKDEGVLPEESRKNFRALLDWVGLGAQTPGTGDRKRDEGTSVLEKFMKHSPTSTDSPGSTSKDDGREEEAAEEN